MTDAEIDWKAQALQWSRELEAMRERIVELEAEIARLREALAGHQRG